MSAGVTADRIYDAVKQKCMMRDFRPGERLDPARLAQSLFSSVTPVRDALNRLSGEGLIEQRTGLGFFIPSLDEPGLRDLYDFSYRLTEFIIRSFSPWPEEGPAVMAVLSAQTNASDQMAAIFSHLARQSPNSEHYRAIQSLNDRLHAIRITESELLEDIQDDISRWHNAIQAGDRRALLRTNFQYHRKRLKAAAFVVRAAYQR